LGCPSLLEDSLTDGEGTFHSGVFSTLHHVPDNSTQNAVKRIPIWVQTILVILLFKAIAKWILAPLLDVLPAYIIFGLILLVGVNLFWWKVPGKRSLGALLLFSMLWGSFTLVLYGATLDAIFDDTSSWWTLAGSVCFGMTLLVVWLLTRGERQAG